MLRDLESPKHSPKARIRMARSRVLQIAIMFSMLLTSQVGQASSVRAAGPSDGGQLHATISLRINMARGALCANQDFPVNVTPFENGGQWTDNKGKTHELAETHLPALKIEAFAQDASVATISPARALSGWDQGGFGVMAATFTLHTLKPGTTRVYFETAAFGQYIGPGVDIQVVPCKYKITIRGTSTGSGDNVALTQIYTAEGEIVGDANGALTGDANVNWHMTQAGDCYTANITTPPSAAHLKGTLSGDGDSLTVNVTFDPLMESNTVRAAGICARSGATATSQGQLQPAPIVFSVPSTGGSTSQPIALPDGVVTLTGSATITALPIEAK